MFIILQSCSFSDIDPIEGSLSVDGTIDSVCGGDDQATCENSFASGIADTAGVDQSQVDATLTERK